MTLTLLLIFSLLPSSAVALALCRIAARSDMLVERYIPLQGLVREPGQAPHQPEEDLWSSLLRQRSGYDCQHHL